MKMTTLVTMMFVYATSSNSQTLDTLYYKNYQNLSTIADYDYYRVIEQQDNLSYLVKEYYKGGILKSTYYYKTKSELDLTASNIEKFIKKGKVVLHGDYLTYENDTLIQETKYNMGKSIYGPVNYYHGDTLYMIVDEMPSFQGGSFDEFRNYIASQLTYPQEAAEKGIKGKVFVQFHIDRKGQVKNVRVVRGADPILDNEAVRVIKTSPNWIPGKNQGKTVSVIFTMPIVFDL